MRTQFYGIVERANAIIGHFRPVARAAVLAKPRLGPPLLAKAVFAMREAGAAGGLGRKGGWGGREAGAAGRLGRKGAWGGRESGAEGSMGRKGVWGGREAGAAPLTGGVFSRL